MFLLVACGSSTPPDAAGLPEGATCLVDDFRAPGLLCCHAVIEGPPNPSQNGTCVKAQQPSPNQVCH
jgi:hypothetical protein